MAFHASILVRWLLLEDCPSGQSISKDVDERLDVMPRLMFDENLSQDGVQDFCGHELCGSL